MTILLLVLNFVIGGASYPLIRHADYLFYRYPARPKSPAILGGLLWSMFFGVFTPLLAIMLYLCAGGAWLQDRKIWQTRLWG